MDDIKGTAIGFEAVKTSMTQTKQGYILRLAIHPNDVPTALMQDWVGTRYMVGMQRLGDDDQPEPSEFTIRAKRAVQAAGMLCRNRDFQRYVFEQGWCVDPFEHQPSERDSIVADALRNVLGIKSRKDFEDNKEAVEDFERLRAEFIEWQKMKSL